jgi:hypothetical protein
MRLVVKFARSNLDLGGNPPRANSELDGQKPERATELDLNHATPAVLVLGRSMRQAVQPNFRRLVPIEVLRLNLDVRLLWDVVAIIRPCASPKKSQAQPESILLAFELCSLPAQEHVTRSREK